MISIDQLLDSKNPSLLRDDIMDDRRLQVGYNEDDSSVFTRKVSSLRLAEDQDRRFIIFRSVSESLLLLIFTNNDFVVI